MDLDRSNEGSYLIEMSNIPLFLFLFKKIKRNFFGLFPIKIFEKDMIWQICSNAHIF